MTTENGRMVYTSIVDMQKQKSQEKNSFRETLKSLVIALLFVFLLRHFFLEPFKIPTPSMEPTLIGDPWCGDFILVNKCYYQIHPPERWDVVVFYHPLNPNAYFIKRLVGLPGEKLQIKNGNIYIHGTLARKPDSIQEVLKQPVFLYKNQKIQDFWKVQSGDWEEQDKKLFLKDSGWMTNKEKIRDVYSPKSDGFFSKRKKHLYESGGMHIVGEIALEFSMKSMKETGSIFAQIRHGQYRFLLSLKGKKESVKSELLCYRGEAKAPYQKLTSDFAWQPSKTYSVKMSNFDECVKVIVEDSTIFTFDYSASVDKEPGNTYESSVKWGGEKGFFVFENLALWRDIYYIDRNLFAKDSDWMIPQGKYFVLGDNSPQSSDSRDWKKFSMLLKNGTYLEGDQQSPPRRENEKYYFCDRYGIDRAISIEELKEDITTYQEEPFVPQDYIFGKAFLVFWPPIRIKRIR